VLAFDGSTTNSTLIVPRAKYQWNFGDGTKAVGPSVVHSYGHGGICEVTLQVTDRGGNQASLTQTVQVLGATGGSVSSGAVGSGATGSGGLKVRLQLMPQSLRGVLRAGVAVHVSSNQPANGVATLSISRRSAKQAHLKAGRGPSVVIARGTLSQIKSGTVSLHLHMRLSRSTASKLEGLGHVTLTVRLALVAAGGGRIAVDAAGRY
jgi:PKD domain